MASESVAEGSTREVIFLLRCKTMVMNPRDNKYMQHNTTVLTEEEGMSLAVKDAKRAVMDKAVTHKPTANGAAVDVIFMLPKKIMIMDPSGSDHGNQSIMLLMEEMSLAVEIQFYLY